VPHGVPDGAVGDRSRRPDPTRASPVLVPWRPVAGRRITERSGVKKILWPWGFWIFVTFYVVTDPANAATFVHSCAGWLGDMATGVSSFVTSLSA
jgi:hypothetical protein